MEKNNKSLENKILNFEREKGIIFPKQLKNSLLEQNGYETEQVFTNIDKDGFVQECMLLKMMSFEEIQKCFSNLEDIDIFIHSVPNATLIPFGELLGSPIVCIASSKEPELHGKIYVWSCDFRATYQADSLADFLSQLRVYEEVLV